MTASVDISPVLQTGLRLPGMIGALGSVIFLLLMLLLAHLISINGAVITAGKVVVSGKPKSIQHLDGGIVRDILVRDGDTVKAGQILVRLDDTILKANLEIYQARLANAAALRDRLKAEWSGAGEVIFADDVPALTGLDQSTVRQGQVTIFKSRREVHLGRLEQLEEKIRQFRNQIAGINALVSSKEEQLRSMDGELTGLIELTEKGFMRRNQVLAMQRSRADLYGQLGEHKAELARIANSIRDTEMEMMLAKRERHEEAVTELRDTNTTIEELTQQILSTHTQLDRIDIAAPVDGIVHEMQVATLGGVVPPGATILQIIPTGQGILFETRAEPGSVDQIYVGQPVTLRLSAFNHRTTPDIEGKVANVSPDVVEDQASGTAFYRVMVAAPQSELDRLGGGDVVPGMPVEAFLQTDERTVLSYLTKPIADQLSRAFREE